MAGLLPAVAKTQKQTTGLTFYLLDTPPPEPVPSDWIHHWLTPSKDISVSLARAGKGFMLRFPSLADFVIDEDGCSIGAWQPPGTDDETLRHLLLDQVLPRVLAYRGRLVLHASAVCVESQAIAFMGETGWGKSTLAASLHLSGYQLLTDDGLLIEAEDTCIQAIPGYCGLRLLPQSIKALFNETPGGKPMAPYTDKNRVRLSASSQIGPVKLAALFVLNKPDLDGDVDNINVSPLSKRDACMELVRNSFQLDVSDLKKAAKFFVEASAVVEQLPVFSLSYPRDFSRLSAVHEAILQQYKEASSDSACV